MKEYVAFDLETTGLSVESDQIIEIGAVKINRGRIVGKYNCIVCPQVEVSDFIVELTGITREQLEKGRELQEGVEQFLAFVKDYPVLGHNLMFDYKFMKTAASQFSFPFEKQGVDTLKVARKLLKYLSGRKLSDLCEHYHYVNPAAHRAYDDALATAVVFEGMKKEFSEEKDIFMPKQLHFKVKKEQFITEKQKRYLNQLIKYHRINNIENIDLLTRSAASREIDRIILRYGVMK